MNFGDMKGTSAMKSYPKKAKTYKGKSLKLGHGGRALKLHDQLAAKGLPEKEIGGIIGKRARAEQAAPGQRNFHPSK